MIMCCATAWRQCAVEKSLRKCNASRFCCKLCLGLNENLKGLTQLAPFRTNYVACVTLRSILFWNWTHSSLDCDVIEMMYIRIIEVVERRSTCSACSCGVRSYGKSWFLRSCSRTSRSEVQRSGTQFKNSQCSPAQLQYVQCCIRGYCQVRDVVRTRIGEEHCIIRSRKLGRNAVCTWTSSKIVWISIKIAEYIVAIYDTCTAASFSFNF